MTHEKKMENLCDNLRFLRKKHGLSKVKMARVLGIGIRTLNTLEQGTVPRRLGSSVLIRASEYFQISTDALFSPTAKETGLPG